LAGSAFVARDLALPTALLERRNGSADVAAQKACTARLLFAELAKSRKSL
jgi:hypothetical protein